MATKQHVSLSVGQLLRMTKFQQQRPPEGCESAVPDLDSSIADQRIRLICVIMVVFALILIAIMLITSYVASSVAGWVAVVGASIVFGSTGVPMKTPALKSCQVDSFVFALYNSIGIFIVSIPIIAYLLAIHRFQFQPWAILGAADICTIGWLAFMAVQRLGYCKAPAIWAGTGMVVAFLWGAFCFSEPIRDLGKAIAAIVLLVFGVYCVSTSQGNVVVEESSVSSVEDGQHEFDTDTFPIITTEENKDNSGIEMGNTSKIIPPPSQLSSTSSTVQPVSSMFHSIVGYMLCIAVGFFDGSLLVPFKLTESQSSFTTSSTNPTSNTQSTDATLLGCYQYLASFGLSSIVVSPILFAIYCVVMQRPLGTIPSLHIHVAALPGISSGILWATANFMSVHATYYLGIKIGFPLTQTCILFAAAWGVLYFEEFSLSWNGFLVRFVVGVSAIIIGSYLIGASG